MKGQNKEQTKERQTGTERSRENRSYSEGKRPKLFCFAFNLGFCQLICKVSLIFKSKLELQLTQVNLDTRKDFRSLGIRSLYEK